MNPQAGRALTTMKSFVKAFWEISRPFQTMSSLPASLTDYKTVITHHPCWHFRNMICWSQVLSILLKLSLVWTLEKWHLMGAKTNGSLYSANIKCQKTHSWSWSWGQEVQIHLGKDCRAYLSTRSTTAVQGALGSKGEGQYPRRVALNKHDMTGHHS